MLSLLIILPLIGVLLITLMEKKNNTHENGLVSRPLPKAAGRNKLCLKIALLITGLNFIIAILLWLLMDDNIQFQYIEDWGTLFNNSLCHFILGVDGISLLLVLLTTFITPLLILCPPKNGKSPNTYIILILLLESMLIGVFVVLDLLLFYICYESVLIPMFLIIIIWGSRE
jgi:NADH-ubiquinone oxidoreductase chain 4